MNTTDEQLAQMQAWRDTHPAWTNDPNAGPRVLEDQDSLARDRLSRGAARGQRRFRFELPVEEFRDETAAAGSGSDWWGEAS